jgi:hypothetical protein
MAILPTAVTIAQLITATSHAVSILGKIGSNLKGDKLDKAAVMQDMLDLQTTMMDMQGMQQNIVSDNAELRAKVQELQEALKFTGELEREDGALYLKSDVDREHPYCMACWGYEKKLVGITIVPYGTGYNLNCKICAGRTRD